MSNRVLSLVYLVLAIGVLSFYGFCACEHIVTLPPFVTFAVFTSALVPVIGIKTLIEDRLVSSTRAENHARTQFLINLVAYSLAGAIATLVNNSVHGLPLNSGMIVMVGSTGFGVVSGIDQAMVRQRIWFQQGKGLEENDSVRARSFVRSLWIGSSIFLGYMGAVLFLTVLQDVKLITAAGPGGHVELTQAILVDFLLGVAIFIVFSGRLIFSYALTLKALIGQLTTPLERVSRGDFTTRVPVLTRDEFGEVAARTNHMIGGLREREKIRARFGKVVSSNIAERLMAQDTRVLRRGEQVHVAMLFTDLRNFTTLTEVLPGADLLRVLNDYLELVSRIVVKHHGYVEKYIGDAVMAVFGLEGGDDAGCNASLAAAEVAAKVERITLPDGTPIAAGVGVHCGMVTAGIVGPEDRFEYTVIGDTVNTAARLESKTKELGQVVLISQHVYKTLRPDLMGAFTPLGPQPLKGKLGDTDVYGLTVDQAKALAASST